MRLIDADALDTSQRGNNSQRTMWWHIRLLIKQAPTIEAEPVKHGRWVFEFELAGSNFYHCSVCDRQEALLAKEDIYEFCPYCHCGAKMDKEEEE
jgi:hypothetical protein